MGKGLLFFIFYYSIQALFAQEPKLMLPIGHTDQVISACFSPDGKKVLTGSKDFSPKIWDAETGAILANLTGEENSVLSACFSPDGKKILSGSGQIWDAQNGKLLVDLDVSHPYFENIYFTCFSPDSKKVFTVSDGDRHAKICDAHTGALISDLKGHIDEASKGRKSRVYVACFSPDSKKIATVSHDHTAKIWDCQTGTLLANIKGDSHIDSLLTYAIKKEEDVNSICFSPDGKKILMASGNFAQIWDAKSFELLSELKGHFKKVYNACFSPDGQKILTASAGDAKIWDAETGRVLSDLKESTRFENVAQFSPEDTHFVNSTQFSPDGKKVITAYGQIWDVRSGLLLVDMDTKNFHSHISGVNSICFSPDSKRVLTASRDATAKIWDAKNGKLLVDLKGHTVSTLGICFSLDGKEIITLSGYTADIDHLIPAECDH